MDDRNAVAGFVLGQVAREMLMSVRWLPLLGSCFSAAVSSEETRRAETPQTLYVLHCSGCHGLQGAGAIDADVPPLPGYIDALLGDPRGRLYVVNVGGMVGANLPDADAASVLNWIVREFAGKAAQRIQPFTAEEVHELRKRRPPDSAALRREIAGRLTKQGGPTLFYPWP